VNIHSKLVGAIDAVVLCLTAAVTIVMIFVLLSPSSPVGREHYSVTIEALAS
jgi:hypothetical protein